MELAWCKCSGGEWYSACSAFIIPSPNEVARELGFVPYVRTYVGSPFFIALAPTFIDGF